MAEITKPETRVCISGLVLWVLFSLCLGQSVLILVLALFLKFLHELLLDVCWNELV